MRCLACNQILSDKEATRRSANTNEFVDLCDPCLIDTGLVTYTNPKYNDDNQSDEESNGE